MTTIREASAASMRTVGQALVASDLRRHGHLALATLLIWCAAGPIGSMVQAADDPPAQVSDPASDPLADRLEALVEQAAARVGRQGGAGDGEADAEVLALRAQLQSAETQIALLKNVVIQALRAQSAAEEALRREQAGAPSAAAPAVPGGAGGAPDAALADRVEALTATVQSLSAEVAALRGRSPSEPAERDASRAPGRSGGGGMAEQALDDPAAEEDAMLPGSGMGGQYEPLFEEDPAPSAGDDMAALAPGDPIKVAEVHFNSGSAELTPGGERKALEAGERIRDMEPAKVRVIAFADRVGGAAYNRVLSQERALSIAAVLESVGLSRNMIEVVGSGEEGIPERTADGVPEPLNRCAGIFVLAHGAG